MSPRRTRRKSKLTELREVNESLRAALARSVATFGHVQKKGAAPDSLWRTKEGFRVQVKYMTDLHLYFTLGILLSKARNEVYAVNEMGGSGPGPTIRSALYESSRREQVNAIIGELRFRGIIGRLPETF